LEWSDYRDSTDLWSEDGQGNNENDGTTPDIMDSDDMRKMTILLCLLIPGIAILIICSLYMWPSAREINWKKFNLKVTAEDESAW
jgi:hypothetical protein